MPRHCTLLAVTVLDLARDKPLRGGMRLAGRDEEQALCGSNKEREWAVGWVAVPVSRRGGVGWRAIA